MLIWLYVSPTQPFSHLCFSLFLFISSCLEMCVWFYHSPTLLPPSACSCLFFCVSVFRGATTGLITKAKTLSALCRDCKPLLRCVCLHRTEMLSPQSPFLSLSVVLAPLFLFPPEKWSIRSCLIKVCHGGHILFINSNFTEFKWQ